MATSVSMQSPIPDYGNFGQVAANQWNAAQERALKEDLHDAEMELEWDKQDFHEWQRTKQLDLLEWKQNADYDIMNRNAIINEKDAQNRWNEVNYQLKQRADQKKLAQAKLEQTLHNERLEKRFQSEYEEPSFWESAADWLTPDIAGWDLYDAVDTKEEWMDEQGVEYSDYFDLYDDQNINYKDLDIESLRYLRETDPSFDWGVYGSDDNLADLLSQ